MARTHMQLRDLPTAVELGVEKNTAEVGVRHPLMSAMIELGAFLAEKCGRRAVAPTGHHREWSNHQRNPGG